MSLLMLPYELLGMIADYLPDNKCIKNFSETSKLLHEAMARRWAVYATADKDGWKAISWAIRRKDNHFVKYLVAHDIDVNYQDCLGLTPLHWGIRNGGASGVVTTKLLLTRNPNMTLKDNAGLTPLQWAVQHSPEVTELLLEKEATQESKAISLQDRVGQTALHCAATKSDEKLVRKLLKAGADPEITCGLGRTPLLWAASKKSLAIIKLLVEEKGCNVHQMTKDGRNVLHLAATEGTVETVTYFAEKEVDMGTQDCLGRTPLHWAAMYGNGRTFRALLKHGADPGIKNKRGQLVNDWAGTFPTIGDALRDVGIDVPKPQMRVKSRFTQYTSYTRSKMTAKPIF